MEPTKTSKSQVLLVNKKYQSGEYITPETPQQKVNLRDYLLRCYMFQKLDPRTGKSMICEQLKLIKQHFQQSKKQHLSFTDYVYQNEVLTGICLLEQPLWGNG